MPNEIGATGTQIIGGQITNPYELNRDFIGSARWQTIRDMQLDTKVYALHAALRLSLSQARYSIEPSPDVDEISAFVDRVIFKGDFNWGATLRNILQYPKYGFMLFEKVFKLNDEGQTVWSKWGVRLPWTIAEWKVDLKNELKSVRQVALVGDGNTVDIEIPAKKLIRFTFEQEGDDYSGTPLCRFIRKHFKLKDALERVDAIAGERHATAVPTWKLPEMPGSSDPQQEAKAQKIVANLRSNEQQGVVIPPGHDLDIKGIQGGTRDIVSSIRYHEQAMSLVALAGFLDLGKTGQGSRALAVPLMDFFELLIIDVKSYTLGVINEQIEELIELNFGPQDEYSKMNCTLLSSRDLKAYTESLVAAKGRGLISWSTGDEDKYRKEAELGERDPLAEVDRQDSEAEPGFDGTGSKGVGPEPDSSGEQRPSAGVPDKST